MLKSQFGSHFLDGGPQMVYWYTTNPHERLVSNGRASWLPSARRATTERPPTIEIVPWLPMLKWYIGIPLIPTSDWRAMAEQVDCQAFGKQPPSGHQAISLVGISGVDLVVS